MDEQHEADNNLTWPEYALIAVAIVIVVIAAFVILWQQTVTTFHNGPDNLWLHLVGL